MPNEIELKKHVAEIFARQFDVRNGTVVPESKDIVLANGAVEIEAVFLYADLAGSAKLSRLCPWETTSKIIRAFLDCATRIIRARGGYIRSFDGDRVMGVFVGSNKCSQASICGREIHWAVRKIVDVQAQKYNSIKNNNIEIAHCVGVDVGTVRAVRAGIRNNNDIIWVGKAASFSAKLSDLRKQYYLTYISKRVYDVLNDPAKLDENGKNMWSYESFVFAGVTETVYCSNHWKRP